jgi:hypothetical protein
MEQCVLKYNKNKSVSSRFIDSILGDGSTDETESETESEQEPEQETDIETETETGETSQLVEDYSSDGDDDEFIIKTGSCIYNNLVEG